MNWKENFKKINSFDFWVIHISFACIIGLQVYFYRESTCIMDNAYYLFDMINREAFTIPHNRFIAVFAEFLPWLAIKLHLPLKWVLIGFSVNFLATTYLIFLWIWIEMEKNWIENPKNEFKNGLSITILSGKLDCNPN